MGYLIYSGSNRGGLNKNNVGSGERGDTKKEKGGIVFGSY